MQIMLHLAEIETELQNSWVRKEGGSNLTLGDTKAQPTNLTVV